MTAIGPSRFGPNTVFNSPMMASGDKSFQTFIATVRAGRPSACSRSALSDSELPSGHGKMADHASLIRPTGYCCVTEATQGRFRCTGPQF
jgi:hypothetical protein